LRYIIANQTQAVSDHPKADLDSDRLQQGLLAEYSLSIRSLAEKAD
jgi:hypothetical protein